MKKYCELKAEIFSRKTISIAKRNGKPQWKTYEMLHIAQDQLKANLKSDSNGIGILNAPFQEFACRDRELL